MDKYLGNKTSLLPLIYDYVMVRVPDAESISDPFTGTTNVARYFRARGFNVHVSDLNRFSYVLARTYLGHAEPPAFSRLRGKANQTTIARIKADFLRSAARGSAFLTPGTIPERLWAASESCAHALAQLQVAADSNETPGPIFEYFSKWGKHSTFTSVRGTRGKRNYFSKENAFALDGALRAMRRWWRAGSITRPELDYLLTSIIEEIVITANVSGTFHDFNRERIWPNALQRFTLRMPLIQLSNGRTEIVNSDSRAAAQWFGGHDVCYLDPPYNFRQYSSYYHFLNFIAAYPHLTDVESYLGELRHVRGQNMADDEPSDFCYRDRFLHSLRELITSIDADHVFLSYYGGRNHWNHWSEVDEPDDEGLVQLESLFADQALFERYDVTPALDVRQNFQSRVGERKAFVDEYLFYGVRNRRRPTVVNATPVLRANLDLGIGEQFLPIVIGAEEIVPEAAMLA